MTLQTFSNYVGIPSSAQVISTNTVTSTLLDAASEQIAFVFMVPKTGSIRKVFFRTATVTTGATVDVRLETVDSTTGMPSGTLVGANTNASQVIASTDDNVGFFVTLTADASVTAGDMVAIVVVNDPVTPGNMSILSNWGTAFTNQAPYNVNNTTGSKVKQAITAPIFYFEYSDGTTANVGNIPAATIASTSFNSGSTPDERALYFSLPFPCKIAGVDMFTAAWAASATADVVLYDSDGTTALATVSVDRDNTRIGSIGQQRVAFGSNISLSANTNYRIALKPTTVNNVALFDYTFGSTTEMQAMDGGTAFQLSTRTNGGAWSETTTRRAAIALLLSAFDDGTGGGGGSGGSYTF